MAEDNERKRREPVVPDYLAPGSTLAGSEAGQRLVTIRSMRPDEAMLAKVKLEAEGIDCFTANMEMASTHRLLAAIPVKLQVRGVDVERANEVLSAPPKDVQEGEYVEEEWRCPKCHRKALEFLPVTARGRNLRVGCGVLLIMPVVAWAISLEELLRGGNAMAWLTAGWGALVITAVLCLVFERRGKRCTECGWTKVA